MNNSLIVGDLNISELSDDDLTEHLKEQGFIPGPITSTTRSVYQRKLARLLRNETFIENFEEDAVDPEVQSSPIMSSTMRNFTPSTPAYTSTPSFHSSPSNIDYDDLRRRPLPRYDSSYSPTTSTPYKPWSADDIVTQATPPPPEPEQPLMSPLAKLIALVCIVLFVVFVYYNMESTPDNPFTAPTI